VELETCWRLQSDLLASSRKRGEIFDLRIFQGSRFVELGRRLCHEGRPSEFGASWIGFAGHIAVLILSIAPVEDHILTTPGLLETKVDRKLLEHIELLVFKVDEADPFQLDLGRVVSYRGKLHCGHFSSQLKVVRSLTSKKKKKNQKEIATFKVARSFNHMDCIWSTYLLHGIHLRQMSGCGSSGLRIRSNSS
jgi:hypothetical protein